VNCYPSYESLSKIVCRLGITIDDLLKCKSNKLVDYQNYRTYKDYIIGDSLNYQLSESILENPNFKYILNCYINDCNQLRLMIDNYILGNSIDFNELDMLCEHIKPIVISDVEYACDDFGGGAMYHLNSRNIEDYKDRTELFIDRVDNDDDYALTCEHKILFPNIDDILLTIADEDINVLRKHILFIEESELTVLMRKYLEHSICNSHYDKKHIIFKLLYNRDCKVGDIIGDSSNASYHKLLEKYQEKQRIVEDTRNKLFIEVAKYVVSLETISIIQLQKEFSISFNVASEMIKRLENKNVISTLSDGSPRRVLMNMTDLIDKQII
jgi:ribosomal protein S25